MSNKLINIIRLSIFIIVLPYTVMAFEASNDLVSGHLDNGLTYFIHEDKTQKNNVSLRLIVKAGSVLEKENERGIAHFVEHMVFKGSENFAPGEVITTLESLGAAFGVEVNAYTSFEHTEYRIDLPLDKKNALDKALLIMSDWAFRTTISNIEVEKERDVILDEKRRRNSAAQRAHAFAWSQLSVESQFEQRHPIGLPEVIANVSPQVIRDFYKRWYTPQNMAIIISGDIKPNITKRILGKYFAKTEASNPEALPNYKIPAQDKTRFAVNVDRETIGSSINLSFKRNLSKSFDKIERVRKTLKDELLQNLMSERLFALSQQIDTPFLSAKNYTDRPVSVLHIHKFKAKSSEDDTFLALQTLITELKRAEVHGFHPSEFARAKARVTLEMELSLSNSSQQELQIMKDHFLGIIGFARVENYIQAKHDTLEIISLEELNLWATSILSSHNRLIHVSTSIDGLTTEPLKDILTKTEALAISPYIDEAVQGTIYSPTVKAGKIIGTREYFSVNMTELTLENGMRILLKPSKLKKGEILISAHARGGLSQLGKSDFVSGKIANSLSKMSGIGKFTPVELNKLLAGKQVDINTSILAYSRSIQGKSRKEDFASSLQVLHMLFTSSRSNKDAFDLVIRRNRQEALKNSLSPTANFYGQAKMLSSKNHYYYQDLSEKSYDKASFEKADDFFRNSFKNTADLTFFIVGDFEKDDAIEKIKTTLASIPKMESSKTRLKGLRMSFPEGVTRKTVSSGSSTTGLTQINIPVNITEGRYKSHRLQSVVQVLKSRLMKTLRRDMGGTYHVKVKCHNPLFSSTQNLITITFSCDPADTKELVYAAFKEIYYLKTKGITQSEVNNLKTLQELRFQKRLSSNSFWMASLFKRYRLGISPEGIYGTSQVISSMSVDDMQVVIDQIFPLKDYSILTSKQDKNIKPSQVFTGVSSY
ncbi:MAG: zinc protease [Halioglobus sp.]|jgi:zinc protease